MTWQKLKIGDFLIERKERMTPEEANISGISRLEKIDFSGTIHVKEGKNTNTGMILVYPGDLVISGINVEKGALAVYEGDNKILATIHYSSYQYNPEMIDIEYLRYFARSLTFRKVILEQVGGGIKTEIKAKKFLSLQISLPDLASQKEIVKVIHGVESEIERVNKITEKNIKLSKQLQSSILQDAIQGKLVLQDPSDEPASILIEKIQAEKAKLIAEGKIKKQKPLPPIKSEEIPYELPKGWEWVRLGEILKYIQRGPSAKYSEKSNIGIINQKCIQWRGLELDHIKYYSTELIERLNEDRYLGKDDILLNSTGTGTIGRCILLDELPLKSYIADSHVTVLRSFISQKYILTFLSSQGIQDFLNNGGVFGTTNQIELSSSTIQNFCFPLPPLQEQKRIVEKIDELMKSCESLDEQIRQAKDRSKKLMESVLQGVFNG